jgi:uncharacterized protein (TIGR01777 family)
VEPYLWDAASEFPRAALEGADAVIHLAGEPIAQRWTPAVKKALAVSRVDSTKLLVQALSALEKRPPILLSGSAIGFYGDRADEELDEGSAPGSGFLPELCREWENQANLARALGMRVNLLRTGIVLDPQGGALAQMLPPFRWGAGGKLGSGKQWMSWIHIADWVGAVLHLLAKDGESGPVNLTGPVPARNERFTEVLGKVLQRPALLPVPKFALELLFGEMAQIVLGSQQVLPRFLLRHGYEFRHPQLEGALRDLL